MNPLVRRLSHGQVVIIDVAAATLMMILIIPGVDQWRCAWGGAIARRLRRTGAEPGGAPREAATGSGRCPGMGPSAYRIVQEAISNVIKHAAPARCWVTVSAVDGVVEIEVIDDGGTERGGRPSPVEQGHGLIGMRERVMMYGGTFTAEGRAEGGFRIRPPGRSK